MTDELRELGRQKTTRFRQAVPLADAAVDAIIQCGECGIDCIEHQLDHMLGFCCDPDMLVASKRLCRYSR